MCGIFAPHNAMTRSSSPLAPDVLERPNKRPRQSSLPDRPKTAQQQEGNSSVKEDDTIVTQQEDHSHLTTTSTPNQPKPSPLPASPPAAVFPQFNTPQNDISQNEASYHHLPGKVLPDPLSFHSSLVQGQGQFASTSEEEESGDNTPESLCEEAEVHSEEAQGSEVRSPTASEDSSQESESQISDSSIMVGTVAQVRGMLKQHRLFIDDDAARETGAPLIAKAMAILDDRRNSDWPQDQRHKVVGDIKKYGEENELTFVVHFMAWMLGKTRKVPPTDMSEAELQQERDWIDAEWDKDHLHARWNVDFIADCIPPIGNTGDPFLDSLLNELPRVEKPRPDIAWGIHGTAFTDTQKTILENQRNHLAGLGMYDVFFVLEAKSMNASIEEAENQCMRSGCAMVNTRRVLNQAASTSAPQGGSTSSSSAPKGPGASSSISETGTQATLASPSSKCPADMDSFAFTMALAPQTARIFVNWALVEGSSRIQWHMHQLRTYSFRDLDHVNQLHHDMDNILDWGVGSRKRKAVELCTQIEEKKAVVSGPPAKKPKTMEKKDAKAG